MHRLTITRRTISPAGVEQIILCSHSRCSFEIIIARIEASPRRADFALFRPVTMLREKYGVLCDGCRCRVVGDESLMVGGYLDGRQVENIHQNMYIYTFG